STSRPTPVVTSPATEDRPGTCSPGGRQRRGRRLFTRRWSSSTEPESTASKTTGADSRPGLNQTVSASRQAAAGSDCGGAIAPGDDDADDIERDDEEQGAHDLEPHGLDGQAEPDDHGDARQG